MTDKYWIEEILWGRDASRMSNAQLLINLIGLESTLELNNDKFQALSLKRIKTNENREFIDAYYETMRLVRIIRDELDYRKVLLGIH